MSPLETRGGEREDRWSELLAAATVVFAERGYVAASLEEVAGHLGILAGSLYHYVRTKEELLYAIMRDAYETALETVNRHQALASAGGSKTVSFVRIWMAHMRSLKYSAIGADRHDYIRFLSPEHKAEIRRIRGVLSHYVESLIDADIGRGCLKVQIPPRVATGTILTLMNTTREWMHSETLEEWAEITEWYVDLLHTGLRSKTNRGSDADRATIAASAAHGRDSAAIGIAFAHENALLRGAERGARWDELVSAAGEVFAERTYPGASLAEVARRMGVRKASLYHYIGAKEELLFELYLRVHERALGTVTAEAANQSAPGEENLASLITAWGCQTLKRDTAYLPLGTIDIEYLTPEHAGQIRSIRRVVRRYVEGVVVEGVNAGQFAPTLNIDYAVNSLLIALNRSRRWFRKGKGEPSLADWNTQLFLYGFFNAQPSGIVD